jgi:hypothetical protein
LKITKNLGVTFFLVSYYNVIETYKKQMKGTSYGIDTDQQ